MQIDKRLISIASLIVSLAAMSGSLYYSEIVQFFPCKLCWFQRILMYPMNLLIPVALWLKDDKIHHYCLALSIPGFFLSFYHYLLQWDFFDSGACSGIACSTRYVEYLGFITIPFMAGTAFALITALNLFAILRCKD